ncbi:MAG: DJ-1/PfpI family protein [Xanthomonadales bacterium]|nr:DJ-1/PfpI family protein [Xanthomonadales bacterium]
MSQTVLIPVANGTEDIEAVTLIDVLRRAGMAVTVASVGNAREVTCANGTRIVADSLHADVAGRSFDLIALPGGMPGAEHLRDTPALIAQLRAQDARSGLFAAICASPGVVLASHGLIGTRKATAYPGFEKLLPPGSFVAERVVRDGHLVTSRGPGTALEFALALVEAMGLGAQAEQLASGMLARR